MVPILQRVMPSSNLHVHSSNGRYVHVDVYVRCGHVVVALLA